MSGRTKTHTNRKPEIEKTFDCRFFFLLEFKAKTANKLCHNSYRIMQNFNSVSHYKFISYNKNESQLVFLGVLSKTGLQK